MRKIQALLEEGALNSAPEKVRDAKFGSSEFFDPHDIVQVKYEMVESERSTFSIQWSIDCCITDTS